MTIGDPSDIDRLDIHLLGDETDDRTGSRYLQVDCDELRWSGKAGLEDVGEMLVAEVQRRRDDEIPVGGVEETHSWASYLADDHGGTSSHDDQHCKLRCVRR